MNFAHLLAAVIAAATFAVHIFVGGVFVARPLLMSGALPPAAKWLSYYCWHVTTILLAAMAGVYAAAAFGAMSADAAVLMTVLAASFSVLCVAVALKGRVRPWRFPASYLFALVAAAGIWGLLG
ncbi:MAG: hypothetical protein ACFBQW_00290 [Sphingomonadaceae bacterium]